MNEKERSYNSYRKMYRTISSGKINFLKPGKWSESVVFGYDQVKYYPYSFYRLRDFFWKSRAGDPFALAMLVTFIGVGISIIIAVFD